MSEAKLVHARELIQQKRYDEARRLLKSIDHPTAVEWLAKLDVIDSSQPAEHTIVTPTTTAKANSGVPLLSILSTLIIVILTVLVITQQFRLNTLSSNVSALATMLDSHESDIVSLTENINEALILTRRVSALEGNFDDLVNVVNSHASDINSLASDIRSVARVADNANRYAHSHGYSDSELKTDLTEIYDPLNRILSLRGVVFAWNNSAYPDLPLEIGRDYGVLAQDVREVFPELVTEDEETGLLRVDYEGLIPILIEAIRAQQQEIDELRSLFLESNRSSGRISAR